MAVEGPPRIDSLLVPPISVQVALENAVKHNVFDREAPLDVRIRISTDRVSVTNPLRPKAAPGSPRLGLANLDERCRRVTGQGIEVRLHGAEFEVVVPVLRTSA
jgi:LytS/YehU family sensor histidine kinase